MKLTDIESKKNVSSRTDEQWELHEKEIQRLRTKNSKLVAHQKTIIEAVRAAVIPLPSTATPRIPKTKTNFKPQTVIQDMGDMQLGSLVEFKDTGGLCVYNTAEFNNRADRFVDSHYEVVEIQRRGGIPLNKLNLHVLGDIAQGEDVFPGQGFKIDTLLMDQVFQLGWEVIERILLPLAANYEEVEIFAVPGNHGKQGKKGQASRLTNWDYIIYWFWREKMRNIKHVKFYISQSPFLLYDLYPGQTHALIHGNQARGWMGFPYYGVDRMLHKLTSLTGRYITYLHHGHHHQPSIQDTHIGKKIGNGSFEGGSDYSVNDLLVANTPQQFICGATDKGLTWEHWLRLADYPELKPDENGIFTPLMFQGDHEPPPERDLEKHKEKIQGRIRKGS